MPGNASERLNKNKAKIMDLWVKRTMAEVPAAHHLEDLALRDSLANYLDQLEDALSTTIERTQARQLKDKEDSTRIGRQHGRERAASYNYSLDQVIFEYHILRQTICDVLEAEELLTPVEREVIVCSVEQAVNDAATQFSNSLKEIQEQLTHSLVHDFRTPLAVAKLSTEMILRRPDEKEHILHMAKAASVSLNRLEKMIQDLLDSSRMKAGEFLELKFTKGCDLIHIVKNVAEEMNFIHKNRIIIKSSGACVGTWNEKGLRRIVENLTTNALKYGKADTPVTISIDKISNETILSVHNEGEPIPNKEIAILFQQFRRSKGTEAKSGWGIGLTIVKGMTEAHHGKIEVISNKEDGTTFKIILPEDSSLYDGT